MRDRRLGAPQLARDFHALVKQRLVVLERNVERQVFTSIVAALGSNRPDRRSADQASPIAGQHAERAEMMVADPYRVHAEFVGIECFCQDIDDEPIRRAQIVAVVIVAQRK
jgi:hypothetical protein